MKNKKVLFAITLFLISTISIAQNKIKAATIMEDIKAGKSISINNSTIIGVLDFTFKNEALKKKSNKKKSSWFNWNSENSTNEIKKIIDVNISFINCTFKDDVLAYIPDKESELTFTASFENETIFKNCIFEHKAMFKYSRFEKNTDFSGSTFKDDSTFKYAKFDSKINFTNTTYYEIATFKYAKFNSNVSFKDAIFKEVATYKYTQFLDGVSFKNTNFKEDLNIKYMKVSGEFNITNMKVDYEIDSKYTKINGKSFNKHLINAK
ncbi:pentapeptide repeat-containing protein [Polaribacter sp. NJDZ03]|uniref:pentapeptide repeat-containing protein n=1 Tax=Polaribacter sp. NJDZ03 TaxID=2855841 RepID=UPI001C4A3D82|nr:pentapeptide repeat-containing protein [Polaribacter sp. NJDZ03]